MMNPYVLLFGRLTSNRKLPSEQTWRTRPTERAEHGEPTSSKPRHRCRDLRWTDRAWIRKLSGDDEIKVRLWYVTAQWLVCSQQNGPFSAPNQNSELTRISLAAEGAPPAGKTTKRQIRQKMVLDRPTDNSIKMIVPSSDRTQRLDRRTFLQESQGLLVAGGRWLRSRGGGPRAEAVQAAGSSPTQSDVGEKTSQRKTRWFFSRENTEG